MVDRLHFNSYYNRGLALYDLGEYQESLEDYDEAIRLESKNLDVYNRGLVRYRPGEYQTAVEGSNESILFNSEDSDE